ncbi:argininosuccinate synthase [Sulfurifustis variabilis]|uniref:argininosuccinate synthase n=1 Tax=Sulfurifustis variabilis TaxID=1675686 RepID=A0A1B4V7A2_9GAMM|nr:argininosuccinate synthase [Sulfurifustis variabilis]
MMQELIDSLRFPLPSRERARERGTVNGVVRLKLYKGNVTVAGRKSDTDSLFDPSIATFEEDRGAYNQKDAEGFVRLKIRCG